VVGERVPAELSEHDPSVHGEGEPEPLVVREHVGAEQLQRPSAAEREGPVQHEPDDPVALGRLVAVDVAQVVEALSLPLARPPRARLQLGSRCAVHHRAQLVELAPCLLVVQASEREVLESQVARAAPRRTARVRGAGGAGVRGPGRR